MAAYTYQQIKEQYENTKPIRGRSEDVRPAGKRRRDWERVVKTERGYAYQMHGTNCVEFTEEKLILRTGGWTTVGTGKFINDYAPVSCGKRYNAIWVGMGNDSHWDYISTTHDYHTESGYLWVPIPAKGEVTFTWDSARQRYVLDPTKIQVRTVNRKRANEARKRIKPLLDYCKTMLKLSDGEVRREDIYRQPYAAHYKNLLDITTDEQMSEAFYAVLRATQPTWTNWQRGVYAYRIPSVQRTLYKMHDAESPEVYDYEWVDPSSKMPTNHVGYT